MKRRKRSRALFSLLIIIILLLSVYFVIYLENNFNNSIDNKQIDKNDNIKKNSIVISMVGDMLVHDSLYNDAWDDEKREYNFYKYLPYVKNMIKDSDIAYYNQETILGGSSIGLSSYPSFNSPQEVGDAMIDAGFNTVSLATNHTLDRGERAILLSREYWNSKKDVLAIGSYSSNEEKDKIENTIRECNNIKYAFLNYTYGTNGIDVPDNKDYLVNLIDKNRISNDIDRLRDKVDLLIVAMHWGVEYTHYPTDSQRELAKFLADKGVDIVIGTHPHVIQPVEFIGDTLVFYSLGNFMSAQKSEMCYNYKCFIGMLSSVTFSVTDEINGKKKSIDDVSNELIYTYHNNYKDFMVIGLSNSDIYNYLDNYHDVYNRYADIIRSSDKRIHTAVLSD